MAQHERADTQEDPAVDESPEFAGYTALPNLLLQELGGQNGSTFSVVLFIARHTIGRQIKIGTSFHRVKTVCLSFDEFLHGRHKRDGTRMPPPSGLSDDKAVMRGCEAALAQGLIEVGEDTGTRGVRLYSIPARFWRSAGFSTAIQMLADPRVPSSFEAYRLIPLTRDRDPLLAKHQQCMKPFLLSLLAKYQQTGLAQTWCKPLLLAKRRQSGQLLTRRMLPLLAFCQQTYLQNLTKLRFFLRSLLAKGQQWGQNASSTAGTMPADISDQPFQEAARDERKHRMKHRKGNIDRSYDTIEVQNAMQKQSEKTNTPPAEEHLRTESDPPAAAQELEPQQPTRAASPDRQASGERTGVRLHLPPDHAPPAVGEEAAEVAARHQRVLALQRELALLKRTPSMQLLARQHIPRLEAEIKQLVTTLQARA